MTNTWVLSALWVGLALVATLFAIWFRVSTALSEIVIGTVAQLIIGALLGRDGLLGNTEWITFLAGTGAIVLTFLAGAELDPTIFRAKWREAPDHRPCWVPGTVSWLHAHCILRAALVDHGQLALRRCTLYHFSSSCLRCDARIRVQRDGVW